VATVREGSKTVLVIVDVQVRVMAEAWEAPRVIANIANAVERARSQGAPVLWVQHENDGMPHGSPQWQWVPELKPAPGEPLIPQSFNSGFEQTTLDAELAKLGATHITLAGAETNWCIRATAYGALERGYDLTLVKDGHTAISMALDNGVSIEAPHVIDDLNVAMNWLEYPGRRNRTVAASALDFVIAGAQGR